MKRTYNGFDVNFNARMARGIRAFGGLGLEKTINDTCAAAVYNPNWSLFCNQADSGLPWLKQFKATVVYPLPVWGIYASIAYQDLNGYVIGTAAPAYRPFTAGTSFDEPRGRALQPADPGQRRHAGAGPGDARCRPCRPQRPARRAGNGGTAAAAAARSVLQQARDVRRRDGGAEDRLLQRAQLRRLLGGVEHDLRARDYLQPSVVLQGRIIRIGAEVTW